MTDADADADVDTRHVHLVDAFTEEPMAGNPAGVVPDAAGLTDDQMGAVAAELGASETAFVVPSEAADRRLRYFTPEREVDLCGHATVAAIRSLYDRGVVAAGASTVETNVGVLDVDVDPDGTVWLTQSPPTVESVSPDRGRVADALGVAETALSEVGADLPLARASTGLPFLVVPVSYFEGLSAVDPDLDAVERLCRETDTEGLYAFTFDTLTAAATLHGRAFAPLVGIPEDPVTGTASGAVAAYLRDEDALDEADPLAIEQGHFLDRPGRVLVRTGSPDEGADGATGGSASDGVADGALDAPQVGGQATVVLDGDLTVPPAAVDDIVEA
jgi:trans-2,3-dihydro-3-hydroxyanthranilate isomerase